MFRSLPPSLLLALIPAAMPSMAPAQRTLADVQRQFESAAQGLGASPSREQIEVLRKELIGRLQKFLADEASGDDRWNGRLMLADWQLSVGDRDKAAATLRTIDTAQAPALLLVTAATMAQHLDLQQQRDAWIDAGLGKDAPLADRLAIARLLLTVLHEVDRGERVFATALEGAKTDEDRAMIRWHRADAMRDFEDPMKENAWSEELERLARDLPKTYWGDVAKDVVRATKLRVGDDAIPFRAKTRSGDEVSLEGLRGKTIVLAFCSAADMDSPRLVSVLGQLKRRCGDKLAIVGVNIDRNPEMIARTVKDLGIDFPVVGDGKGVETDIALRWFVRDPVVHVIDGSGKVAALFQQVGTADGRAQLTDVVERTTGTGGAGVGR
jgi:peroxiredoxin